MRAPLLARSALATGLFRARGVRCGVVTCEGRLPVLVAEGEVSFGRRVAFRNRSGRSEVGARRGATLRMGERAFVNQGAVIVASVGITIGDDVRVGDGVAVYDSDFHALQEGSPVRRAPVTIGDNVWLARNATVLPGVVIGDHSVVAAGAVVTGPVPARTLVAGNPARIVRALTAADGWRRG